MLGILIACEELAKWLHWTKMLLKQLHKMMMLPGPLPQPLCRQAGGLAAWDFLGCL